MSTDVLVIGGGLAGLTTAVALVDRGLDVVVVERDSILGGRARSWTDPVTGDPVHIGPHIFLTDYPNTWKLLSRLGTQNRVVWQHGQQFVAMVRGTQVTEIRDSGLPPPYHYVPSLLRAPEVRIVDVLSNWVVTSYAFGMDDDDVLALDGEDGLGFLRRMGVTDRFIDWYWRFTALAILNVPLEECSAGALMRFYQYQVSHRATRVGFADGGLGDVFAPAARACVELAGSRVLLETEVSRLLTDTSGAVTGAVLADGRAVTARHVVAALPPSALRRLVPDDWSSRHPVFAGLDRFKAVPYVSVYLWFDRKLTRRQFWARAYDADDLNCDFYDLSNIHRGWLERPSLICSNIIWSHRAADLDDGEIVSATIRELAEFLPAAAGAQLRHSVVNRVPMAIHAPHPGTERLRPPVRTTVPGLLLAGDWIATGVPSSMEGAVRSGWLAAEEILADEGRPETLARGYRPATGMAAAFGRLPRPLAIDLPIGALQALRRVNPRWGPSQSPARAREAPTSR